MTRRRARLFQPSERTSAIQGHSLGLSAILSSPMDSVFPESVEIGWPFVKYIKRANQPGTGLSASASRGIPLPDRNTGTGQASQVGGTTVGGSLMKTPHTQRLDETSCRLNELSSDMRRILTVQFKEFIHHIEDYEFDLRSRARCVTVRMSSPSALNRQAA